MGGGAIAAGPTNVVGGGAIAGSGGKGGEPGVDLKRRKRNPDNLPMKNMEIDPQRRDAITILLGPNRVANIPPIREKRR